MIDSVRPRFSFFLQNKETSIARLVRESNYKVRELPKQKDQNLGRGQIGQATEIWLILKSLITVL